MNYPLYFSTDTTQLAALSNQPDISPPQPVLCLHGWLDNAASFMPLAQQLPELALLALEFPGHGHSAHRSLDAHYYFFDWVQDVVALCRQQRWQALTVIGHSMGGMVATALAASFPELITKLILIDSLGFITDEPQHAARQLREGITSRLKPSSPKPVYATVADAAAARQRQSDFSITEALLLANRGTVTIDDGVSWRADMRLRHSSVYRLSPAQADALTGAVQCPALAILAQDGPFYSNVKTQAIHYPHLQQVQVDGGHHCHMTRADVVAQHVRDFLLR
jgi:pimeloyl-ACP methyl ester carboxylesterase